MDAIEKRVRESIRKNQYVLLAGDQCPLTIQELKAAEQLMDQLPYEAVTAGDAGDAHQLQVGRFRRDVTFPVRS